MMMMPSKVSSTRNSCISQYRVGLSLLRPASENNSWVASLDNQKPDVGLVSAASDRFNGQLLRSVKTSILNLFLRGVDTGSEIAQLKSMPACVRKCVHSSFRGRIWRYPLIDSRIPHFCLASYWQRDRIHQHRRLGSQWQYWASGFTHTRGSWPKPPKICTSERGHSVL